MTSEQEIEQEIQDKGLTSPRVTPETLDLVIDRVEYNVLNNSTLTHCMITLKNGFTVTGESACIDPANFDEELGQKIAYDNAREKLWPLLGFLLADKLNPLHAFEFGDRAKLGPPPGCEEYKPFRKKAVQWMKPYDIGDSLEGVSVSEVDDPNDGGMIAVNMSDPSDKWFVNQHFFNKNYEPVNQ